MAGRIALRLECWWTMRSFFGVGASLFCERRKLGFRNECEVRIGWLVFGCSYLWWKIETNDRFQY